MATALPSSTMKRANDTASSSSTDTSTTSGSGTAENQNLIDSLILAPSAVDRIALIPNDADFVYDFQNPPTKNAITSGDGGRTVRADRKVFPPLVGTGGKATVACSCCKSTLTTWSNSVHDSGLSWPVRLQHASHAPPFLGNQRGRQRSTQRRVLPGKPLPHRFHQPLNLRHDRFPSRRHSRRVQPGLYRCHFRGWLCRWGSGRSADCSELLFVVERCR